MFGHEHYVPDIFTISDTVVRHDKDLLDCISNWDQDEWFHAQRLISGVVPDSVSSVATDFSSDNQCSGSDVSSGIDKISLWERMFKRACPICWSNEGILVRDGEAHLLFSCTCMSYEQRHTLWSRMGCGNLVNTAGADAAENEHSMIKVLEILSSDIDSHDANKLAVPKLPAIFASCISTILRKHKRSQWNLKKWERSRVRWDDDEIDDFESWNSSDVEDGHNELDESHIQRTSPIVRAMVSELKIDSSSEGEMRKQPGRQVIDSSSDLSSAHSHNNDDGTNETVRCSGSGTISDSSSDSSSFHESVDRDLNHLSQDYCDFLCHTEENIHELDKDITELFDQTEGNKKTSKVAASVDYARASPPITPEVPSDSDSDKTESWSASSDVASFFVSEASVSDGNGLLEQKFESDDEIITMKQMLLCLISPILWNRLHEEIAADNIFREPVGDQRFQMMKAPRGTFKFRVPPGKKSINHRLWNNIWKRNWKIEHFPDRHQRVYAKVMMSWSKKNNLWTRKYLISILFQRINWMRSHGIPFVRNNVPRIAQAGLRLQSFNVYPTVPRISLSPWNARRSVGPPRRSTGVIRGIRDRFSLAVGNRRSIVTELDQEGGRWLTDKGRKVHKILGPKYSTWHSYRQ